jgi:hypothetical protein
MYDSNACINHGLLTVHRTYSKLSFPEPLLTSVFWTASHSHLYLLKSYLFIKIQLNATSSRKTSAKMVCFSAKSLAWAVFSTFPLLFYITVSSDRLSFTDYMAQGPDLTKPPPMEQREVAQWQQTKALSHHVFGFFVTTLLWCLYWWLFWLHTEAEVLDIILILSPQQPDLVLGGGNLVSLSVCTA